MSYAIRGVRSGPFQWQCTESGLIGGRYCFVSRDGTGRAQVEVTLGVDATYICRGTRRSVSRCGSVRLGAAGAYLSVVAGTAGYKQDAGNIIWAVSVAPRGRPSNGTCDERPVQAMISFLAASPTEPRVQTDGTGKKNGEPRNLNGNVC